MTLDDLIARTAASLERQIEKAIEYDELLLAEKGATQAEIAEHVAIRREEAAGWKAECLAEIQRGLTHVDAPSTRIQ
ncbi:hypothetical protein [Rhizobium leguminosarum]|uniref:hypothetical protein n=1 Tax=Rhizobium leguminosarum TaxID=384 RepID=UPI001618CD74|nr:hypothetical protein [Rhizobium leguminosarum]MBB4339528.1 hypothetical protein [Rhizobium leguminosarum]MBB6291761.1 hypothetical protein [Rhizobium leguminosarum]